MIIPMWEMNLTGNIDNPKGLSKTPVEIIFPLG